MPYNKSDFWSVKAQKEGYPARSVYKLKEMDEKFAFFRIFSGSGGGKVLDLGASPGSWSLYALQKMRGRGFLVSVDLSPLSREYDKGLFDGGNFLFLQGDMNNAEVRNVIISHAPFNLILSDAAPATTGNSSVDTARSLALAESVLSYAESFLVEGGNLAVKVFQGGDSQGLLRRIRDSFQSGKSFKPQACRAESFETYYIGLGAKAHNRDSL